MGYQENLKTGWISIYRSIVDHWIFPKSRPFTEFEAWITILLQVNHSSGKVKLGNEIFNCERGESLKSLDTWARTFNWTKSKVRRFFKVLENDGMIELKNVRKTTHLKVCNYDTYQIARNTDETQTKRKRNTGETQVTPNNNDNNVNNENNNIVGENPPPQLQVKYSNSMEVIPPPSPKNISKISEKEERKKVAAKKEISERAAEFMQDIWDAVQNTEYAEKKHMLREFYEYWIEHGKNDRKMRFEKEASFGIIRRLGTWERNETKFQRKTNGHSNQFFNKEVETYDDKL